MLKKIGVILIAVLFLGSMAWMPVIDSVQAAVKAAKCECGKDCQCEHCKTGKGECHCKAGEKGCSCGKGCSCEHCKTGKGECKCHAGRDGKGCACGKDCKCEHCATGKGACHCKPGDKGCSCGKGCGCEHCKTGKGECKCHTGAAAGDVKAPTADADYAKTMVSKAGAFKASYTSEADAVPVNKIISWKLKVETADGKPVKDAEIAVEGAMPEHGHGFPTQPKVTKNYGDGTYLVEGIKFSMTGWWTVTFSIKAGGKTDNVTFNLQLK